MTNASGNRRAQSPAGTVEQALANGHQLLDQHPALALQQADALLRVVQDARAFELAAAALRRLDRPTEAEQAELSGISASFSMQQLDDAAVANEEGRKVDSLSLIEAFLGTQPDNLLAHTMAAELEIEQWKLDRAEARLNKVLERAPSFLRAIMLLGQCKSSQGRLGEAIAVFQSVLERKPNNPIAVRNLAQAYAEANQHEKAAEMYGYLLELDPMQVELWIIYAQELRIMARKDESIAAFRRALALDPNSGGAWWGLAYYFPTEITEADIITMELALESLGDASHNAGPIHVALGILAERRGEHAEAFRHISRGKELRAGVDTPDASKNSGAVDELIGAMTPELLAALSRSGCPDDSPIFIIGMPRSGTTLLERILSCHSQIEAGGELPIIGRLGSAGAGSTPKNIVSMTGDDVRKLGELYLECSQDYRTGHKPRFIDKMNSNWFRVGLIRMMLPNARIIDLRRNALDCCWSNFKMMFAEGSVAANDQRDIARFYRDYVRMVDAVDAAAPGGILKVRYEDLVDDIEGETRRILAFLGLEYEPACIDFHKSTNAVATPSSEQVRRPINREGIGSSEPYHQWLGPMIEELGDLAD